MRLTAQDGLVSCASWPVVPSSGEASWLLVRATVTATQTSDLAWKMSDGTVNFLNEFFGLLHHYNELLWPQIGISLVWMISTLSMLGTVLYSLDS